MGGFLMCKVFSIIFIYFVVALPLSADIYDRLGQVREYEPTCFDIESNAAEMIPEYYREANFDTIQVILDYVQEQCGLSERLFRAKILMAIARDDFSERLYDERVIDAVIDYANGYSQFMSIFSFYREYDSEPGAIERSTFDGFTEEVANIYLEYVDTSSLEYLFCSLYSNDTTYFFDALKSGKYIGTKIHQYYHERIERITGSLIESLYFIGGVWYGMGDFEFFGTHPQIGVGAGLRKNRIFGDLTFMFRFLNSKEPYNVEYMDEIVESKNFHKLYIGVEPGYVLCKQGRFQFDLLGGLGYDTLLAVNPDDKDAQKWLHSFNINGGIGLKYYYGPLDTKYFGLQVRMTHNNFNNGVSDELAGDAISLRLIWNYWEQKGKRWELKKLHYF